MPSTNYAYVNGRFVPEAEATVSIFDRGFLYGDGVFETVRVGAGKIFRLAAHLQRLNHGLQMLHIESPLDDEEIRVVLCELLERNNVKEGFARVYITRGGGDIGLGVESVKNRSVVAVAQSRRVAVPDNFSAIISTLRVDDQSPFSGVKSANRLPYVLAKWEAAQARAHEAVLLNGHDRVVEFAVSNLFVVKNGALYTPPLADGALPGITRDIVLLLAAKLAIPAYEVSFGTEMFGEADEVIATNSIIGIAAVAEVDGAKFSKHYVVMRLREAYQQLMQSELAV